jgi:DNA invertase Pin-like site-specific DNA recombinase
VFWQSPNHQSTKKETLMSSHSLARTTALGRAEIVRRKQTGHSTARVSRELGISKPTVRKWYDRGRESATPLKDRSSRPRKSPTKLPDAWADAVLVLRKLRFTQLLIAQCLRLKRSTVARVCKRSGLARLPLLDAAPPVQRYVKDRPGELVHLDIKKLARIV